MTTEFAKKLIRIPSVTPDDGGCIKLICERLEPAGFVATHLKYGEVDNLWLTHGQAGPVLCFLGHTDVVPPGPGDEWDSDPFIPEVRNGNLHGRGAADMKGSLAAMVIAFERFVTARPDHDGTLAMLLTSDEEGVAVNGTAQVVRHLNDKNIRIKWCVVGEPSSLTTVGDVIKIGRRGSLTGHLTVFGIQGHVAYPDRASNPVHLLIPALDELCRKVWDQGNEYYDSTRLQISNIHAGDGTDNVIPGKIRIQFNIRYSTETSEETLIKTIRSILDHHQLKYELEWLPSSKPFLTSAGELLATVQNVIRAKTGQNPELSTSGGTSDGRFIAPTGAEVIELGPVNSTIHKVNECISVTELDTLTELYHGIIESLLANN